MKVIKNRKRMETKIQILLNKLDYYQHKSIHDWISSSYIQIPSKTDKDLTGRNNFHCPLSHYFPFFPNFLFITALALPLTKIVAF